MSLKRLPEVIALILLILFFYVRFPSHSWNRVIHSDGKGYYAHLPAIFIYQDLEYNFADEMEKKYYPPDGHLAKHFRFTFRGETVNKTFSGITILWLPFFLIAHFLSYLLGFPADGYNVIYQTAIGLSAIFYFWLGSKLLLRLLKEFRIPELTAGIVLIALTFGSNLFYYILLDPSLTHSYNFSIIAAFLLFVKKFSDRPDKHFLLPATASFALLLCIRPQDGFIAFSIPFVAGSAEKTGAFFLHLFRNIKKLLLSLLIFLAFIAVPVTLWYLQTGYFLVYSYGEEGFDFSNPQFLNVLFSYQKGLFLYSPLILLAMFGFIYLFLNNRFRFFSLLLFFLLNTYIIASWEEWWYGCSYGHRVFIDFYAIAALLLGWTYLSVEKLPWLKWMLHACVFLAILLNFVQVYQHYNAIVPACFNNKALYWQNFLKLTPDARANFHGKEVSLVDSEANDMEEEYKRWEGLAMVKSKDHSHSGSFSARINKNYPYGPTLKKELDSLTDHIKVSAMIYAPDDNIDPLLVTDLQGQEGRSFSYHSFSLKRYMYRDRWFLVEFSVKIGEHPPGDLRALIYFWHPEDEAPLYIDDMKVEFLTEQRTQYEPL